MTPDSLDQRPGLPEPLRILLAAHPRESWQAHPQFHGLVSFWLERHMMFRQIMDHMSRETEAFLDGDRDPRGFAQGIARYGGLFVNQLHGHHQIEDHHYFPLLREKDARIERGFDLLDADHHALDGILNRFVGQANGAIEGAGGKDSRAPAGALRDGLADLSRLIGRHLEDEEDLIVPVILKHGADGLG
ncbi:hemerythrin domain-containing protein [Roseibacterium sp. SDUM158016]|uniref:hemerythrin domain-containing protein n=1 Tax=Roseicyclus sediminis TaxID=2980997 RepID=UPI0021D21C3F|nr:hemerythrin domain-containing protein [Roseibacterium sp. SDUM158016]MCU4651606.1 hemerythrin domain-containing protein [Roseibacterium sp. SDUM158016]